MTNGKLKSTTHDALPDWSPDGTLIAFERSGLFLYSLFDSSVTPLFSESNFLGQPDFSPDGRWIACANVYIYKVLVNGDSLQQLTQADDSYFPDWSPDGTRIAYDISAGPERGIYILDVASGETRLIYRYARFPIWFPDGARLLIKSYNFGSFPEPVIIDTSGTMLKRLVNSDGIDMSGHDVSPDGNLICVSRQREHELPQLWVMSPEGTGMAKITCYGGAWPAFSPDGEWIAFTFLGADNGCLWLMRTDGSDKHQITF